MIRYSSRVEIQRPPADVYAALLDSDRFGQWTDMVDVRFDAGPPAVGSRGSFRLAKGPIAGRLDMEIVELVPGRRVVIRISHPWLDWMSASELEPVGRGTRLTYAGDVVLRGWRRVLEPLMAREVRAGEAGEAERLKALLERDVSGAVTGAADPEPGAGGPEPATAASK